MPGIAPLNPRDFLILFALSAGPRHGYGLLKDVARLTHGEVRIDPANLYRSLKRMIRDGLVTETGPRPDGDDERRRYYGITDRGLQVVKAEAGRMARLTEAARTRKLIPDAGGTP
jgi:DNA-binding PadR family transcriptional regulator